MLNPIWLHTFVTLVDTGHFTHTAEKLFMTQPGVSQHINKLEQACGHVLIKRENKTFDVTEQGKLVYRYAKGLAAREHSLFEQLAYDDPHVGDITIASSGSVALLLYPQLVNLQSRYRQLSIRFVAAPNHQILQDVQDNRVDMGIVTDINNSQLFESHKLGEEELCLVVHKETDLNVDKAAILMQAGLISHPDAIHYLSLYFSQCQEPSLSKINISDIPVVGAVNQIGQILHPIAQGIGFTVLPKSAVSAFPLNAQLQIVPPVRPVIEELYRITKRNRVLPARFDTVNQVIEKVW